VKVARRRHRFRRSVLVSMPEPEAFPRIAPHKAKPASDRPPFLLDLLPQESAEQTRLSRFYDRLREGRLSTTWCRKDKALLWPPRIVCPTCHTDELEWVDLPNRGRIYAFTAVLAGAPLGAEGDVPYSVGLVELDGAPLRLFGRIEGRAWNDLRIGAPVRVEPHENGDGRVFYRFWTTERD
jgi:uncharacterized OB-fold protein